MIDITNIYLNLIRKFFINLILKIFLFYLSQNPLLIDKYLIFSSQKYGIATAEDVGVPVAGVGSIGIVFGLSRISPASNYSTSTLTTPLPLPRNGASPDI
jgi:hypothetical protein